MKEKMGQMGGKLEETNEDAGEGIKRLKMLLADLIEHLLRADRRAWNRIIDTHLDILDKRSVVWNWLYRNNINAF